MTLKVSKADRAAIAREAAGTGVLILLFICIIIPVALALDVAFLALALNVIAGFGLGLWQLVGISLAVTSTTFPINWKLSKL